MTNAATNSDTAHDEAAGKGAVEDDGRQQSKRGTSLSGQIGHRDEDELLKDSDTDFPEPDAKEEHTGEAG